jgi:NTE family protein
LLPGIDRFESEITKRIDGKRRRLLDEIDAISSVFGGRFTAAYYGLFGDRIFEDFEAKFLKNNVQGALFGRMLSPLNWPTKKKEKIRQKIDQSFEVIFVRAK